MGSEVFDFHIALDGPGLNGMIGVGGISRARFRTNEKGELEYLGKVSKFYPGLSGGHAVQIRPDGKVGYVGNFSQQLCFYDPASDDLKEVKRISTLKYMPIDYKMDVHYRSQTHVVWLRDNRHFLVVFGPDIWKFDYEDLSAPPVRMGPHGVLIPHAMKLSASGEYICCGSKDSDQFGWSHRMSIIRLSDWEVRTVWVQETVWHLEAHPTKDLFYGNTQNVDPQRGMGDYPYNFTEYTFAFRPNYLYEVDAKKAFEDENPQGAVTKHTAFGIDQPHFLTSDLVVAPPYLYSNYPASSSIARVDLETLTKADYIDERVGILECLTTLWRSSIVNIMEAFSRAPILINLHFFLKALRISRGSLIDGGYGLQISPCGRFLLSAHRGRNEVYVYDPKTLKRVSFYDVARKKKIKKIKFESYLKHTPHNLPWTHLFSDPRLGFHHSALSVNSAKLGLGDASV